MVEARLESHDGRTNDRPMEEMEKGDVNGLIKDDEGGDFAVRLRKGGGVPDGFRGRVRVVVIRDDG
jgi:hypothetical protein